MVVIVDAKWLFEIKLLTPIGQLWTLFSPFKFKEGNGKEPDLGDQSSDPSSAAHSLCDLVGVTSPP